MTKPLPFLERWSRESTEELLAYEGRYRTDSIVVALEAALLAKVERGATLSEEERVVLAVEALEREVNNGGFDQFFRNTPEHAPSVESALHTIGCKRTAKLAQRAVAALGLDTPATAEAIEKAMRFDSDARDDELAECDDAFYEMDDLIEDRLLAFVKAHRSKIKTR